MRFICGLIVILGMQLGCKTVMADDGKPEVAAPKEAPKAGATDVLFMRITGGLSKKSPGNKEALCEIKTDHADVANSAAEIQELIKKAAQAGFDTAYHFRAQVPSEEIYAVDHTSVTKDRVLLVEDFSTRKTRKGAEAQKLIEMITKLCPKN